MIYANLTIYLLFNYYKFENDKENYNVCLLCNNYIKNY